MADFDPYRDWLGIRSAARPLNYYDLLGVAVFTKEPPVLAEAAEEQTARLQPHLAGPHAAVAQRVAQEIATARRQLLSADGRRAYDAQLRQGVARPASAVAPASAVPPPATAAAVPPTAMPATAPYATPAPPMAVPVQTVPYAHQYIPQAVPAFGIPPSGPPMPLQIGTDDRAQAARIYARSRKSSWPMAIAILLIAIFFIGGALAFANRERLTAMWSGVDSSAPPEPATFNERRPSPISKVEPEVKTREEAAQALSSAFGMRSPQAPTSRLPPPAKMTAGSRPSTEPLGTASAPDAMSAGERMMAKRAATLPAETPPAGDEERAAVNRELTQVRKALAERNLARAREQLDLATIEAFSSDTAAMVERTRGLVDAVERFWTAVADGAKKLSPKDTFTAGDDQVTVVAVDDQKLSLRVNTNNREFQFSKLPPNLARTVAERALDTQDPESKVAVGAFLSVEPSGDRNLARQLWDEAGRQGANVAGLIQELDERP